MKCAHFTCHVCPTRKEAFDDRVTAHVEPDDVKTGRWMVVFRQGGDGDTIGIPLRDATESEARGMQQSLAFAFGYGARYARDMAVKEINRHWWNVTAPHTPED